MNTQTLTLLARAELKKHGLLAWRFEVSDKIRSLGICYWGQKLIRIQRTYAAREDRAEVWDTLLHEIAHALTPTDLDHGETWQAKCRELGAKPVARCQYEVHQRPRRVYVATCNKCVEVGRVAPTHTLRRKARGLKLDGTGLLCARHSIPLTFEQTVIEGKR